MIIVQKMRKILIAQVFICLLFLFSIKQSSANEIFTDTFNTYIDHSFPNKWVKYSPPPIPGCSAIWEVVGGEFGVSIPPQGPCADNMIPANSYWPSNLNRYIYEVDMRFVSGSDHNLPYFIDASDGTIYELHFQAPNDFTLGGPISSFLTNVHQSYLNGNTYHIKIVVDIDKVKVYIDDVLVRDVLLSSPLPLGTIGLRAGVGGDPASETWFDNIKVTSIDNPSNDLNVPLLKQTNSPWGGDLYDSANLWSTGATDISRWGCAITSAAMVLHYNNIAKLPDGQDLTPGSLNSYLKSIPDGYISNGMTNWHAISVMTKKAKINNPNFGYHALVDKYIGSNDSTTVNNDLTNNIPDILQVTTSLGSHFVVAKGANNTSFNINDPFYNRTDLSQYNNTFNSARSFVPSNTDLSYIMLVVDPTVDILVKDDNGNNVGQGFIESPIGDPLHALSNTKGPLREVIVPVPASGQYTVLISSQNTQQYTLHSYLYDIDGNLKMVENQDIVNQGTTNTYTLNFDKNIIGNTTYEQVITIKKLDNDIDALFSLGHIKKEFYKELVEKVKEIEKYQDKKGEGYLGKLNELYKEIGKKKGIDNFGSEILLNDLQQLINSI